MWAKNVNYLAGCCWKIHCSCGQQETATAKQPRHPITDINVQRNRIELCHMDEKDLNLKEQTVLTTIRNNNRESWNNGIKSKSLKLQCEDLCGSLEFCFVFVFSLGGLRIPIGGQHCKTGWDFKIIVLNVEMAWPGLFLSTVGTPDESGLRFWISGPGSFPLLPFLCLKAVMMNSHGPVLHTYRY